MKYYQVVITYPCDICGARHVVSKGSDGKIDENKKNDLMVEGFQALKKDFDTKHPEDKFDVERVFIEETNHLGQVRGLPVEKSKIKDVLAEVDITEQKGEKKSKEKPKEIIPFKGTGQTEGMSFEDIKNKVIVRITELIKANKSCREAMDKLGIQFKETKAEIVRLQSLLKAVNESTQNKGKKKNGRKKQNSKSK